MPFLDKEFFGMGYPFPECARPQLLKTERCLDCSVRIFCKAPEKRITKEVKDVPATRE